MTTGRINQVTISGCRGGVHLLPNTSTDLATLKQEAFQGGCSVTEARDAPTLQVLFGPSQLHPAFHGEVYKRNTTGDRNTLSQVSQVSGTDLPVQRQGSPPSVRTTIDGSTLQGTQAVQVDPKWLFDKRV